MLLRVFVSLMSSACARRRPQDSVSNRLEKRLINTNIRFPDSVTMLLLYLIHIVHNAFAYLLSRCLAESRHWLYPP